MEKRVYGIEPEFFGPKQLARHNLVIKFLKGALPAGTVLDAGCGNGNLAIKIAKQGYQVEGVELSPGLVKTAEEKIAKLGLDEKVKILRGNLTDLKFPQESFDAVVCSEVLEHIKDHKRVVKNFYRVLKPGGACIITVPINKRFWSIEDEWVGHYRRYSKEELIDLFNRNGFSAKRIRYIGFPLTQLYYKFVYIPLLRLKLSRESVDKTIKHPLINQYLLKPLSEFLSKVFYFDLLFGQIPRGLMIVVLFRKRGIDE